MNINTLKEVAKEINIRVHNTQKRPILSNLFAGLGIYHAIYHEDSYIQTVLAWIAPSTYVGYHLYKNHEKIGENLEKSWKKFK